MKTIVICFSLVLASLSGIRAQVACEIGMLDREIVLLPMQTKISRADADGIKMALITYSSEEFYGPAFDNIELLEELLNHEIFRKGNLKIKYLINMEPNRVIGIGEYQGREGYFNLMRVPVEKRE